MYNRKFKVRYPLSENRGKKCKTQVASKANSLLHYLVLQHLTRSQIPVISFIWCKYIITVYTNITLSLYSW